MKKLVFSLLITMICSTITAQDDNHFKTVQYDPQTGKLSWAKKVASEQLTWHRKREHDFHVRTPWFNNKKLEVNVSQLAHIVGAAFSIKSMNPELKKIVIANSWGGSFPHTSNHNRYNLAALLFCTYRLFAGERPFKVVDQEEVVA